MAEKRTLPDEHRAEAEKLALNPYVVTVAKEVDADGQPVFLALHPELDGCLAHGKTIRDAIENLKEARIDYIQVLLLSGQPVPMPASMVEGQEQQTETVPFMAYDASEGKAKPVHVKPDDEKVVAKYAFTLSAVEG